MGAGPLHSGKDAGLAKALAGMAAGRYTGT